MMPDSERFYALWADFERRQGERHTEVVTKIGDVKERVVRLESRSYHDPETCPGNKRTEAKLARHLEDHKEEKAEHKAEKRDASWKAFIWRCIEYLLAGVTGGYISTKL